MGLYGIFQAYIKEVGLMELGSTHATKKLQSQSFLVFCIEFFWKVKLEGAFVGALWPPFAHKITTTPSRRFLWSIYWSISG
jgi:hypothetical protein